MDLSDVRLSIGVDNDNGISGSVMDLPREPHYSSHIELPSPPANPLAIVILVYFFANAISAAIIHGRAGNEPAAVFVFAVFASQAILLVIWVGLGNVAIWIRLPCALAWCLWVTLLIAPEPQRWELEVPAAVGLMVLLGAAPYGLLKVLGFRIVWRYTRSEARWRRDIFQQSAILESPANEAARVLELPPDNHLHPRASVQFSIVQIFAWTALAGLMAVLARIAGVRWDEAIPTGIPMIVATAVGYTTLWAVLGSQQVGARLLAPFAVIILVTLVAAAFTGPAPGEFIAVMFSSLALATAAVAAVLASFRAAGYRVSRNYRAIVRPAAEMTAGTQSGPSSPWDSEPV
jgi:hypothetical protein